VDVLPESTIVSERSQWDQRDSTLNSQQQSTVTKNKVGREDGSGWVLVWDLGDSGLFSF
jgi:hypothetical protein